MEKKKGEMTVGEAGHLGGEKGGHKGGEKVLEERGPEFYSKIGHKGGQKVKRLIEKGEEEEAKK
jgi:general stress protein YciG